MKSAQFTEWKIVCSWAILATFAPSAVLAGASAAALNRSPGSLAAHGKIAQARPSLSDAPVLKKVIDRYNSRLDIDSGYLSFLKKNLSPLDRQFVFKTLKDSRMKRLPLARVDGNRVSFEGAESLLSFEKAQNGKLKVSYGGISVLTSEDTFMQDFLRELRKSQEKGLVSSVMNLLIPDANAFFGGAIVLGLMGAVAYAYKDELKELGYKIRDNFSEATSADLYVREVRDSALSCSMEREKWEENWYEFFDFMKDERPDLNDANKRTLFDAELVSLEASLRLNEEIYKKECLEHAAIVNDKGASLSLSLREKDSLCEYRKDQVDCLSTVLTNKKAFRSKYAATSPASATQQATATKAVPAIPADSSASLTGVSETGDEARSAALAD